MEQKFFTLPGQKNRAFTLIELLIVISIISILISLSVVGSTVVTRRARDAQRKNDMSKAQGALVGFYSDHKTYPLPFCDSTGNLPKSCAGAHGYYDGTLGGFSKIINTNSGPNGTTNGLVKDGYLDAPISDPTNDETHKYRYRPSIDGLGFEVSAQLENEADPDAVKDNTAAPARYEKGTDLTLVTSDCTNSDSVANLGGCKIMNNIGDDFFADSTGKRDDWTYGFAPFEKCEECKME